MQEILQAVFALLAAAGLLALGWLLLGRLVTPIGDTGGPVYAVVPAAGDGSGADPVCAATGAAGNKRHTNGAAAASASSSAVQSDVRFTANLRTGGLHFAA